MKITDQYGVLFLICMGGVFLSHLCPFPMPSGISSMVVLFCLLAAKALTLESLQGVSDFLLENMALFFVPPGVGILAHMERLRGSLLPLIAICIVSTLLTFAAAAAAVAATQKAMTAWKKR